jgi:hypothetical protein
MSIIHGKRTNRWVSQTLQIGFTILLVDEQDYYRAFTLCHVAPTTAH